MINVVSVRVGEPLPNAKILAFRFWLDRKWSDWHPDADTHGSRRVVRYMADHGRQVELMVKFDD